MDYLLGALIDKWALEWVSGLRYKCVGDDRENPQS